ncbi:MAG: hypothetical protein JJU45_06050 [Acidimicrobiia bacterium]|nr:hypothetical protein [Acidimicrobiia bacterium]
MLDHVFTDAIGALRDALEGALLERQAFEERFHADVLLGDLTWETSYGLPGEGMPPRVQADLTLVWPTWAQTAYRTWYIGESFDEPPRIEVEVVLRVQRLAAAPDPALLLGSLPEHSPLVGRQRLDRSGPTVETSYPDALDDPEHAIEVSYEGAYELDEDTLADGSSLDDHFAAMGGWISSTLVRIGDLTWNFLPPIDESHFGRES